MCHRLEDCLNAVQGHETAVSVDVERAVFSDHPSVVWISGTVQIVAPIGESADVGDKVVSSFHIEI